MYLSGGLIPTFLWMRDMGLYDSPAIMFVMGMVTQTGFLLFIP